MHLSFQMTDFCIIFNDDWCTDRNTDLCDPSHGLAEMLTTFTIRFPQTSNPRTGVLLPPRRCVVIEIDALTAHLGSSRHVPPSGPQVLPDHWTKRQRWNAPARDPRLRCCLLRTARGSLLRRTLTGHPFSSPRHRSLERRVWWMICASAQGVRSCLPGLPPCSGARMYWLPPADPSPKDDKSSSPGDRWLYIPPRAYRKADSSGMDWFPSGIGLKVWSDRCRQDWRRTRTSVPAGRVLRSQSSLRRDMKNRRHASMQKMLLQQAVL
jgi:hypothetical protein